MSDAVAPPPGRFRNLSSRLLLLTVAFVMLAEVLIWTPSVARYRKTLIEDRIDRAYLSMLALNSMPETEPNQDLENKLLKQTNALAIILNTPTRRILMSAGDMPPAVDVLVDYRSESFWGLIMEAFDTLAQTENRVVRAVGMPANDPNATVEVLFDEAGLRTAMLDFSWRIFTLSLFISLITATLVFISLQWLIVRPIRRMAVGMARFRENPEDETRILKPMPRSDEIGTAQRELAEMQRQVNGALKQKNRLAALGAAVAKINHDLRNTLATAVLVSDKLQYIEDPEVKRVTPRLMKAIDRAIDLCSQTLNYASDDTMVLRPRAFGLRGLIEEVATNLESAGDGVDAVWQIDADHDAEIVADRRHLLRALHNVCDNAIKAGGDKLNVSAKIDDDGIIIEVADNGPGLSNKARENLFKPFAGSGRKGGTGLGLVIARDVVSAHGGDIALLHSGPDGTAFRITIPGDIAPHRVALAEGGDSKVA